MAMRRFNLRCHKCYRKYHKSDIGRMWQWVEPISQTTEHVVFRCKRCGHTYKSKSKAAFRLAEKLNN